MRTDDAMNKVALYLPAEIFSSGISGFPWRHAVWNVDSLRVRPHRNWICPFHHMGRINGRIMLHGDSLTLFSVGMLQGGISNPLIVLLLLWFANKCFHALCVDRWPSSHRVCCGSAVVPSVGYGVSVVVFSGDFNGKDGWDYTACKQSGESSPCQRKR